MNMAQVRSLAGPSCGSNCFACFKNVRSNQHTSSNLDHLKKLIRFLETGDQGDQQFFFKKIRPAINQEKQRPKVSVTTPKTSDFPTTSEPTERIRSLYFRGQCALAHLKSEKCTMIHLKSNLIFGLIPTCEKNPAKSDWSDKSDQLVTLDISILNGI